MSFAFFCKSVIETLDYIDELVCLSELAKLEKKKDYLHFVMITLNNYSKNEYIDNVTLAKIFSAYNEFKELSKVIEKQIMMELFD